MATALVPVFTGTLADRTTQLCDARTLHTFMQVKRDFTTWIKARIRKFGFVAGEDFITVQNLSSPDLVSAKSRAQKLADYHLTLDMAKELSMVENNEQGRAARRYFIECERQVQAAINATPYSVQPGQTLSAEQAEALRNLLTSHVQKLPKAQQAGAMVKGWSNLKAHFGVPYRQIPASEFTEAISIVARHVSEWDLVEDANKTPRPSYDDAVRTQAAFDAASQAAASVQSAVFNAVLSGNDEWKYSRWMLAFIDDSANGSPAYVRQLDHGSFVTTWPRLVRDVANGECMCTSAELIEMAAACMQRLQQRPNTARLAA